MPTVIAHGEMLIDFVSTANGLSLVEAPSFLKAPGGAPANVAVGLARLGVAPGFMGQIGDDAFGHPEDIFDAEYVAPNIHPGYIDAQVEVTELMGNEVFLYLLTGGHS